MQLFLIFLAIAVVFVIYSIYEKLAREKRNKQNIYRQWGRIPQNEYSENDFASISCHFQNTVHMDSDFYIDDITWNDLDMNRVFSRINATQTNVGEEYLYSMLRQSVFNQKELSDRDRLIEYFRENKDDRVKIQVLLSKLGKLRFLNISDYISGKRKGIGKSGLYYKILAAVFVLSPLLTIVTPYAIIVVLASIVLNVSAYFKARDQIIGHLQSLAYIVNMIGLAKKFSKLKIKAIEDLLYTLEQSTKRIKGTSLEFFPFIIYTTENYFVEIIKIFFLGEPIAYHSIYKILEKYRHEINTIYETFGVLDSIISIASYRESLEYFTTPELRTGSISDKKISFVDLYHPLIEKPVPNSAELSKSILVTGSNASGKSTFLKAVAINAILAQTIYTCLAKEYSSSLFKIYSSMALRDNLEAKESYYIVEIKSLKRIIEGLNDDIPSLCVIDEVLRGTNTIERIAASSEIVHLLSKSNCVCICATHDIELAQILGDSVENYHFQEYFDEESIKFDYKIYAGKATTRNAIKLLKILGYDQQIVNKAERRAQLFIDNGYWKEI